ncbi:MAG: hypothetical protein ISS70_20595 [Phycisphaerae bacterium]|nr:hypothetical protein [Phycisphaerae bacterium]
MRRHLSDNENKSAFCLLLWLIFSGNGSVAEPVLRSGPAGMSGDYYTAERVAYENKKAIEAYEKRNAEISHLIEDKIRSNSGNAALLYYQAFIALPELGQVIDAKLSEVRGGREEPDAQVRIFLGMCLPAVEMFRAASRVPQCTWGVVPDNQVNRDSLHRKWGNLSLVLLADARTLAADGKFYAALEQCLTMRRFARHLAEEPELSIFSEGRDQLALSTARDILGIIPLDVDILVWFRNELAEVPGPRLSSAEDMLKTHELNIMQTNPDNLGYLKEQAVQEAEGEQAKEDIRNLTNEEFLSRVREAFAHFADPICRILDSEMAYEQKNSQLLRFIDESEKKASPDPVVKAVTAIVTSIIPLIDREYRAELAHAAHVSGLRAAVEIYLVLAKAGRLPEELPEHLPKDPFTGRDFVYEITDEGFALRCQAGLTRRAESQLRTALEFKVRNRGNYRDGRN